jgi:DNA-binding NarL/FixJ family response regulator
LAVSVAAAAWQVARSMPYAGDDADNRLPTVVVAAPGMLIAQALARALRDAELHVVGCYVRLAVLIDKIQRCRPDVVVVDADLRASRDGAPDLIPQLVAAGPSCRFVVIASEVDGALAREVVQFGIHAVILKSSSIADVVGLLENVSRGRTSFPADVLRRLSEPDTRGLSGRQLEVLEELALGCSNDEIARNLFISTNTVKFHLRAIYERLGVRNRVEATQALATRRVVQAPTRMVGELAIRDGSQPPVRAIPTVDPPT